MMKIPKQTAWAVWCGKTTVDGRSGWSVYWPDIAIRRNEVWYIGCDGVRSTDYCGVVRPIFYGPAEEVNAMGRYDASPAGDYTSMLYRETAPCAKGVRPHNQCSLRLHELLFTHSRSLCPSVSSNSHWLLHSTHGRLVVGLAGGRWRRGVWIRVRVT